MCCCWYAREVMMLAMIKMVNGGCSSHRIQGEGGGGCFHLCLKVAVFGPSIGSIGGVDTHLEPLQQVVLHMESFTYLQWRLHLDLQARVDDVVGVPLGGEGDGATAVLADLLLHLQVSSHLDTKGDFGSAESGGQIQGRLVDVEG